MADAMHSTGGTSGRLRARSRILTVGVTAAVVGLAVWLLGVVGVLPLVGARRDAPSGPDPLALSGHEWTQTPDPLFPLPPYAQFLKDTTIVLDPGHGGRADIPNYKRGPTGLREAEVNLRVANYLREFLEASGARVLMTRETDAYLDETVAKDLRMRAQIANEARADLLLSIHHNAAANPQANYTTVFYHATPDHSPASVCAARHLLVGLNDALRLEQHIECPLVSDYLIYDGDGFAVLRQADGPAVLTESSFHSNPDEEQRLRDPVYNRREAYGLFLGLARWAQAGLPCVRLRAAGGQSGTRNVIVDLDDGLSRRGGWAAGAVKTLTDSVAVRLGDSPVAFDADLGAGTVRVELPRGAAGRLYVDFENVFGQHVLHPWIDLPASGAD